MENIELEKQVYEEYLLCDNRMDKINLITKRLGITKEEFIKHLNNYLRRLSIFKYADIYDKLLLLNDPEEIILFLHQTNLTPSILRSNVMNYFIECRPDLIIHKENPELLLTKKIDLYDKYLQSKKTSSKKDNDMTNIAFNVINNYLNSNYSLERFCYQEKTDKTYFSGVLKYAKTNLKPLYSLYLQKMDSENIQKEIDLNDTVYFFLDMIKNQSKDKPFNVIDFLTNTNYGFNEVIKRADQVLSVDDVRLFRMNVSPFRNYRALSDIMINTLLNNPISYVINGEVVYVSEEIKEKTMNYLKDHNIPISNESFKIIAIQIYKNELNTKRI